jgi:hemolysin D
MNKKSPRTLTDEALDFAPDILAVQERPPAPLPRTILYLLLGLVAILIVWAIFGKLDVIATAEGKLVPQTYLKIVQPSDGGIVKEILVKEGQSVSASQILMRMDAQLSEADSRILQNELALKQLQLRRIDAELTGSPLKFQKSDNAELFRQIEAQYLAHVRAYQDGINQEKASLAKAQQDLAASMQIQAKLKEVLPSYRAQEDAWQKLGKDGFAPSLMVMEKQRERIEKEQDLKAQEHNVQSLKAAITQSEQRISQVGSNYRQQLQNERVETEAAFRKLEQESAKQAHRQGLLELKAPEAGIVKDLATHTVGTVVSPGTILMTLVPVNEPLQAEVQVKNEDVGFVHEGQKVKVKLAAYPFQKYGMVEGKITHLGADATESNPSKGADNAQPSSQARYKAIVTLAKQSLDTDGEALKLAPGMQVVAEIHQGDRTVLEYLLSPVQRAFHEAGRER